MTQKEYKEKISSLENKIKDLIKEVESLRLRNYNYESTLEQYYIINEELRKEKEWNRQKELTINGLQDVIARYERILDKFTISCGG